MSAKIIDPLSEYSWINYNRKTEICQKVIFYYRNNGERAIERKEDTMTKNKIQKEMAERLAKDCGGMLASASALAASIGYNRKYVMDVIRKEGCTAFGEGRQKKYFVEEVAEAFCRNAL